MTLTWINSNFPTDGTGNVIVATDLYQEGDSVSVDPNVMLAWQTSDPPTYAELSALPVASQGWQPIFDQWKAKGIVS